MENKGFTLIELIVVMAIIAVLVLLAAPRFLGYTKDANVTAMEQDAKVLADASEMYHVNKGGWPIIDDSTPVSIGVGGVDEVYPIDKSKLGDSIKNIKGSYDDYGIVIDGEYKGQVFHLNGVTGSNGYKDFGNQVTENKPITFDGVRYEDAGQVPDSPESIFTYQLTDNGQGYEVVAIEEGTTSVSIPSHYNGKPVVAIAGGEIDYQSISKGIRELILPNTIKSIGQSAFYNNGIHTLVLPNSLINIEKRAFQNNKLQELVLPSSLETIGDHAFRSNELEKLVIPKAKIHYGHAVFNNNLFPDHSAFIYSKNNDGSDNKTYLVSYAGRKKEDVQIPSHVTQIKSLSFYNSKIKSVTIPSGVERIPLIVFSNNPIEKVTFKGEIKNIEAGSFSRQYDWGANKNHSPSIEDTQPNGPWTGTWVVGNNTNNWQKIK